MIAVENLTKSFQHNQRTVVALDDVSMDVPAGAVCGVIGPAGSGKSTLARCIALLERPDGGAIKVDGTDLTALDAQALRSAGRRIGVASESDPLVSQRTVAGNVAAPLEAANMAGPQRRNRVVEVLDLVGLTENASLTPDQLTAGQRQRAVLARALATKPSVLLADDPTSGLDSGMSDGVLTVLDRARAELGITTIVATDDMAVVRRLVDDVVVLDQGRVVEQGKVLELVAEPGSHVGGRLLPEVGQERPVARHDVVAEVVLVGFAAVGALLPEASSRFGVDLAVLGGGFTRLGETPVAKFQIGLSGERSESALKWMIERDAHVRRAPVRLEGVAA